MRARCVTVASGRWITESEPVVHGSLHGTWQVRTLVAQVAEVGRMY